MRLRPRVMSLKRWLVYVALAGGSTALAVAAASGWISWQQQKTQMGNSFLATSRAMAVSVEREIDQAVALGRALSTTRSLADGDVSVFDRQAREALSQYGYTLIVNDLETGRQLVNTQTQDDAPLPNLPVDPTWIEPTVRHGSIEVKPLWRSRVTGAWTTTVQLPVAVRGQLRYALNILIPQSVFQRIIDDQRLPANWNTVIVDSDWTIVARLINAERFVGQKAATRGLQNLPERDVIYETRVLEGQSSVSALSRSPRYRWAVAVSEPKAAMLANASGNVGWAALGGFIVAGVAFGVVALFMGRLVSGIRTLASATGALGKHEPVVIPRLAVRELDLIGTGITKVAEEIRDHAHTLEKRVAEATGRLHRETEERHAAEAALAHAQRLEAVGQLTGGIAHDFNNLLMVILGSLRLAQRRNKSPEVNVFLSTAHDAADRGAKLTQSLLAFARKQSLHPESVDVNRLIREFAPVLRGAVGDAIDIRLQLTPEIGPCRIDTTHFQSALLNLVNNSGAVMPAGGRISLKSEKVHIGPADPPSELARGEYVHISVSDNGAGMSPEIAAHAFEPFFTTKDVGKGSGLGLSQVYGFAKQSGGLVTLVSKPGAGTTVHIYLPQSNAALSTEPPVDSAPDFSAARAQGTVMVVEDDVAVRTTLADSLRELGYRVVLASDGHEALAILGNGNHPIGIVLSDYAMPNGMSGIELADRVAEVAPHVKVVVMSGFSPAEIRLEQSACRVLLKPFDNTELAAALRESSRETERSPRMSVAL